MHDRSPIGPLLPSSSFITHPQSRNVTDKLTDAFTKTGVARIKIHNPKSGTWWTTGKNSDLSPF